MSISDQGGVLGAETELTVVTTEGVAGHRVDRVLGQVFGLTVRARHVGSNIGAGLKSMVGGELRGHTKELVAARKEAVERMSEEAGGLGANAVVMTRFDVTDSRGLGTQVCAYGTAVVISRDR